MARRQGATDIHYTFDQQGNVAHRLNSSGALFSSSTFDAYGVETKTSDQQDPFGYNAQAGYYRDLETNLYLCTFRYYDPTSGRWLTRDPIGYAGGINLYGYCDSSPMGAEDPLGLTKLNKDIIRVLKQYFPPQVLERYLRDPAFRERVHRALSKGPYARQGRDNPDVPDEEIIDAVNEAMNMQARENNALWPGSPISYPRPSSGPVIAPSPLRSADPCSSGFSGMSTFDKIMIFFTIVTGGAAGAALRGSGGPRPAPMPVPAR